MAVEVDYFVCSFGVEVNLVLERREDEVSESQHFKLEAVRKLVVSEHSQKDSFIAVHDVEAVIKVLQLEVSRVFVDHPMDFIERVFTLKY